MNKFKYTKVARYQIVKPLDIEWKMFSQILRDIQYDTRQILNKSIQISWEYSGFNNDYKNKFNEYPKSKEVLGYSNIHGYAYDKLKHDYTRLLSNNLSQTIKRGTDKWKKDMKEILRGDKSIPNFKKNIPIDVVSSAIKFKSFENHGCIIQASLIGTKYKKELELKNGFFNILIHAGDKSKKAIIKRLIDKEYKLGSSQIIHKKNKWYLDLVYQFNKDEELGLLEENIMGIDLGISKVAFFAFNNSKKRDYIEGGEIEKFRKTIEIRRRNLLQQGKYCGEGRMGHGRKTRIQPIEKLTGKVEDFKKTTNHKYSRWIVDQAIKNRCGTIQMENLTGISDGEKKASFLGYWTYYDLQKKIEYKAEEAGITIKLINPEYTSQRCNKCGYIDKNNRKTQEQFKCTNCDYGHRYFVNADCNAAKNIATKDIEKIIQDQLKKQEKEYKHTMKYEME